MERSNDRSDRSREAGSTSGSKRGSGWSYWRYYCGCFGSGDSLDEDANDHIMKYKFLNAEERKKLKEETEDVMNRYEALSENSQLSADKWEKQRKKLRHELVANFENRHLNFVDITGNLKNNLEKKFNEKNKKLYETDKYIWKDEEIQHELNEIKEMETQLKGLRENIEPIAYHRGISAAFIDEQIRKSETIKHKYADLQKKEPYYANKPKDTKEQVHNDEKENFRGMGWNNWTDVEIQLERYKACILSKEAHRKFSSKWKEIPYLRDFPLEQAWRLCVDERYQKDDGPKFTVDDELSFIAGTKRLLNAVLDGVCINKLKFDEHSPRKLTAEYYQQLHDIAVEGTYREVREGAKKQQFELGYADQCGTGFPFVPASGCVTGEGYEELQEKIAC